MGAKIGVLLNCGQQSQFSKVRREFDAGRVNLDPPMTCADWPVPGNLTVLHTQTGYTRKPWHRVETRLHRHEREEVATVAVTHCGSRHRPRVHSVRAMPGCWPTLFALPMDQRTTNSFDNMTYSSLVRSRAIAVQFPLPQARMCMVVFSEKMRMLPFSLQIANGPFQRHGPWWIIEVLSSVGNVLSRASGPTQPWTSCWFHGCWFRRCWFRRWWFRGCWFRRCWFRRWWFRGCWFRRCWFRRCFVFRRWFRWCKVNRIAFAILWIALGSFVFASWLQKKLRILLGPATALSSRHFFSRYFASPEAYTRGRLSDGYITMKLNKTHFNCSRHNWQRCPQPRGLVVMTFSSPPLVSIALNWVNQSARERLGSTTSKNAAAQQAQGAPLRNRTN